MLAQSAEALRKIVADSKHGGRVDFSTHLINSSAIVQGCRAEATPLFSRKCEASARASASATGYGAEVWRMLQAIRCAGSPGCPVGQCGVCRTKYSPTQSEQSTESTNSK